MSDTTGYSERIDGNTEAILRSSKSDIERNILARNHSIELLGLCIANNRLVPEPEYGSVYDRAQQTIMSLTQINAVEQHKADAMRALRKQKASKDAA